MNPTRRQFLKQATATVAAAVVTPSVLAESNRPVQWGTAPYDSLIDSLGNRYLYMPHGTGWKGTPFYSDPRCVLVQCIGKIKQGQAVIWNPDGTVRGA